MEYSIAVLTDVLQGTPWKTAVETKPILPLGM